MNSKDVEGRGIYMAGKGGSRGLPVPAYPADALSPAVRRLIDR